MAGVRTRAAIRAELAKNAESWDVGELTLAAYEERRLDLLEEALEAPDLSPDASALVAALLSPKVDAQNVAALDSVWEEARSAFPHGLVPEPDSEDGETILIGEQSRCLFCNDPDGGATHCPHCGVYNRETAL